MLVRVGGSPYINWRGEFISVHRELMAGNGDDDDGSGNVHYHDYEYTVATDAEFTVQGGWWPVC